MRLTRMSAASLLVFVVGCSNGCDTCVAREGDFDAGSIAIDNTARVAPSVSVSASASATPPGPADAGKDAQAQENNTPPAAVSLVPRPRGAPMPLGATQSCGVYDGPLCTKECTKGNCRQECDGVECNLECRGGYCSQVCGTQATCKLSGPGGHCVQVCMKAEGCTKDCRGGGCQ